MNVIFTLSAATSGTTASTAFNISGRTSSNVVSELATGVTKSQLTTGYTINGVDDSITGGTIASISPSTCTGFTTTWSVQPVTPTPTATSTPTPTPTQTIPAYNLIVVSSGSDGPTACTNHSNNQYTFDVYSQFHQLYDNETLYADALGSTVFVGSGGFYSDGVTFGKINSSGLYMQLGDCPS